MSRMRMASANAMAEALGAMLLHGSNIVIFGQLMRWRSKPPVLDLSSVTSSPSLVGGKLKDLSPVPLLGFDQLCRCAERFDRGDQGDLEGARIELPVSHQVAAIRFGFAQVCPDEDRMPMESAPGA